MSTPDPWGDDRETRQAEREQAAREADQSRAQFDQDVSLIFTSEPGRRVWEWLEASCYAYRSTFLAVQANAGAVDPLATARAEGRRTVWADLRQALDRAKLGRQGPQEPRIRRSLTQEEDSTHEVSR